MLLTRPFAYNESLQHQTSFTKKDLFFLFDHSVVFTCSKVINAFKRQSSWIDKISVGITLALRKAKFVSRNIGL